MQCQIANAVVVMLCSIVSYEITFLCTIATGMESLES